MKRNPAWCTIALALVAMFVLGACKSRKRCCTPPMARATAPAPTFAQPTYPPAAPSYPVAPTEAGPVQADLDAAQDKAELERARNADLERQLRLEQDRLASAEGRLRNMESKIADLEAPPAGPADVPDMAQAPVAGAAGELADDLRARSSADVTRDGEMVIVRVTNGFRAGQDLLKRDVQLIQTLNATADALSRYPGATVAVVGHSDTDPIKKSKWSSNDELSMARAQRVAQVLADNGVDRNRISIDGRGSREPLIAPETSSADKARNRRVEIMIRP